MRQSATLMNGLIVRRGGELCRPGGCRRDQKVMMAFLATAPGPARREEPTGRRALLRMASFPLLLGVLLMVAAGAASVLSITREEPSFALTSRLWDLAGLNRLFRSIECLP